MKKLIVLGTILAFSILGFSFEKPIDRTDPNLWCFVDGRNCSYVWDGHVYIVGNWKPMAIIE